MNFTKSILGAVVIGTVAGAVMEQTYWNGLGVLCAVVVGVMSWVFIVTAK